MAIRKNILIVALMTGMGTHVMHAQEEFVSPEPPPPKKVNLTHSPQFWTPVTVALVTIDAAAKAGDDMQLDAIWIAAEKNTIS
jgi:hypothetical protein